MLANRLKLVLSNLTASVQAAFMPGRSILDNILIAHELLHHIKSQKSKANLILAIKLDLSKAYDRVEWDFLIQIMKRMGFGPRWQQLIFQGISITLFQILLNGSPGKSL